MDSSAWVFKAVLRGKGTPSEHIDRIMRDPLFRIQTPAAAPMRLEIVGPLKDTSSCTFEEVLAECKARAQQLGLQATGLAESTASKIVYADIAEQQVLAARLTVVLSQSAGVSRGELKLFVDDRGPRDSRACIPDYVRWRMGCVAQAMGMQIDADRA